MTITIDMNWDVVAVLFQVSFNFVFLFGLCVYVYRNFSWARAVGEENQEADFNDLRDNFARKAGNAFFGEQSQADDGENSV